MLKRRGVGWSCQVSVVLADHGPRCACVLSGEPEAAELSHWLPADGGPPFSGWAGLRGIDMEKNEEEQQPHDFMEMHHLITENLQAMRSGK